MVKKLKMVKTLNMDKIAILKCLVLYIYVLLALIIVLSINLYLETLDWSEFCKINVNKSYKRAQTINPAFKARLTINSIELD